MNRDARAARFVFERRVRGGPRARRDLRVEHSARTEHARDFARERAVRSSVDARVRERSKERDDRVERAVARGKRFPKSARTQGILRDLWLHIAIISADDIDARHACPASSKRGSSQTRADAEVEHVARRGTNPLEHARHAGSRARPLERAYTRS